MKKLTNEEAQAATLQLFERRAPRPVFIGEATLALGFEWSLADTEDLFFQMRREGLIRLVNEEESRRFDVRHGWVRCKT